MLSLIGVVCVQPVPAVKRFSSEMEKKNENLSNVVRQNCLSEQFGLFAT